jgi:hypothetical protein
MIGYFVLHEVSAAKAGKAKTVAVTKINDANNTILKTLPILFFIKPSFHI